MKKLVIALLAGVGLSGCVAVPYDGGPYGSGGYYYAPAVSVGVGVGAYSGYRGGHRHRHYR